MTRRRWINIFIISFVPLGLWLFFWLFRMLAAGYGEAEPSLVFVIPTALYAALQVWLAFRAFTS